MCVLIGKSNKVDFLSLFVFQIHSQCSDHTARPTLLDSGECLRSLEDQELSRRFGMEVPVHVSGLVGQYLTFLRGPNLHAYLTWKYHQKMCVWVAWLDSIPLIVSVESGKRVPIYLSVEATKFPSKALFLSRLEWNGSTQLCEIYNGWPGSAAITLHKSHYYVKLDS